jgi:hypothetical protein
MQRLVSEPVAVVQRQPQRAPDDLTGTVFERLDASLQKVLKDKTKFTWTKPTLEETLNSLTNGQLTTLARIGAMISATAPFLWEFVAKIYGGAWITDNFGTPFDWTDGPALAAKLAADPNFCKDNPKTAQEYHGTTSAFRQIPRAPLKPGSPALHVITDGRTEIHVDAHQPVEGKEQSGMCNYDLREWLSHASDVALGIGGARATTVGRFATARNATGPLRESRSYEKAEDETKLAKADTTLESISMKVQRYAALGGMIGDEWEGDREMRKDAPVMAALQEAEGLIDGVRYAQAARNVVPRGKPGGKWWQR